MRCKEIISLLEKLAPAKYAEKWDNVGLLIGDEEMEVNRIMIALDPSTQVIQQAIEQKCDLLITHHPLIFSPMKKITSKHFIGKRVLSMMNHSIAYYAMHTNMDIAIMADESANMLGIEETIPLEPISSHDNSIGIGRCGKLNKSMTVLELAKHVKEVFSLDEVRVIGDVDKVVNIAAISTGSGEDYIDPAIHLHADVIVTGDIRHHKALDAIEKDMCVIDAGHYGTEHFMTEWLKSYFEKTVKEETIKVFTAKEESPFRIL